MAYNNVLPNDAAGLEPPNLFYLTQMDLEDRFYRIGLNQFEASVRSAKGGQGGNVGVEHDSGLGKVRFTEFKRLVKYAKRSRHFQKLLRQFAQGTLTASHGGATDISIETLRATHNAFHRHRSNSLFNGADEPSVYNRCGPLL